MCKANSTEIIERYNKAVHHFDNLPDPSKTNQIEKVKAAYEAYAEAAKKLEDELAELGM